MATEDMQNQEATPQIDTQKSEPGMRATYRTHIYILISIIMVVVVAGGAGAYFLGNRSAQPDKNIEMAPSLVPTEATTSIPSSQIDAGWKEYKNQDGITFSYPNTWNLRTINVKKGDIFQEGPHQYQIKSDATGEEQTTTHYDIAISAKEADVEYHILSKNDNWQIHIQAENIAVEKCGFRFSVLSDYFKQDPWKELNNPNFSLQRSNFENGWSQTAPGPAGDEVIPHPQIIMNKKEEINSENVAVIILDGCLIRNNPPLLLSIWYQSPFFTKSNFPENMMGIAKPINIDSEILEEMDKIVESLQIL